jgi:hypothetical protein
MCRWTCRRDRAEEAVREREPEASPQVRRQIPESTDVLTGFGSEFRPNPLPPELQKWLDLNA